jgi:hypothetical protein
MRDDIQDQRRVSRWALPGSLVLHSVVAALLIFGLPVSLSQPQKEEAIAVDLVPPPEPSEKAKVEPSPPAQEAKPEKSQEAKVETPSPTSNDAAQHRPSPVLRPVFQFGEEDVGPRVSPNGNSAEDGSPSPTALPSLDKQDLAEPPALAAVEALNQASQPGAPETPAPEPADAAKAQKPLKLQKAKTLFSRSATGDPVATTAMGNLPRGVRAGQLCATELGEQLLHASPPFFPELVPRYQLDDGTVLETLEGAFRANGQWYNLSYRCEVDADATKVLSFAFRVGDPVPRSEWKRRGLPSE